MSLISELQRRNVIRMAGLYLVAAWLVVQVAGTLLPVFDAPGWVMKAIVGTLAVLFVPMLAFSWIFELTPEGLKRDEDVPVEQSIAPLTAQRIEHLTVLVLALALVYFGVDKFVLAPRREAATLATVRAEQAAAPAPPAASAPVKSIAVLPFENLSEDKANGYFADGIQDQILTGLAKIGDLKVISRTSTQRYASRPDNIPQIAKELGVAHILEGSVQRAGDRVRINVQLIAAGSDSHLWADTYDRTLDDVFAVESEVAQKIAESLAAKLTQGERAALAQKPTENVQAYSAYLKARVLDRYNLTTREAEDAVMDAYREAVKIDPRFALAWAELSRVAMRTDWNGFDPSGALREEAGQALAKATALAPDAPQVEIARAVYLYYAKRDFAGAHAALNAVKGKLPGDADLWFLSGLLARRLGLWTESIADLEHALMLAPNESGRIYHLAVTHAAMGDYVRASSLVETSLAQDPANANALSFKFQCLWLRGERAQAGRALAALTLDTPMVKAMNGWQALYDRDFAKATRSFKAAIAADRDATHVDYSFDGYIPASIDWQLQLALSERRSGAEDAARADYAQVKAAAQKALAAKPDNRYVETAWHLALGLAHAGLGEHDEAVAQGQLAVGMAPEAEDRLEAPYWQYYLAQIYALNGDAANAAALARKLVGTKASFFTSALIEMDPSWDSVRAEWGRG